ncbi:hypothetical protein B9Z55_027744 [Caenorhabditis nigoni]|uniref:Uncharacterized protein n=1 Tax=Caenorhabditis nigoni TaxID=1611254 RepID=A0A2G5SE51_9PELO|nr:hypothetical protein B9Z55_027744 [Caenorhabditis nigoni]
MRAYISILNTETEFRKFLHPFLISNHLKSIRHLDSALVIEFFIIFCQATVAISEIRFRRSKLIQMLAFLQT